MTENAYAVCADCWYEANPTEYLPAIPLIDEGTCPECGVRASLFDIDRYEGDDDLDFEDFEYEDFMPFEDDFYESFADFTHPWDWNA